MVSERPWLAHIIYFYLYDLTKFLRIFSFFLFFIAEEQERVQKKTFTNWINSYLSKVSVACLIFFVLFTQRKWAMNFVIRCNLKRSIGNKIREIRFIKADSMIKRKCSAFFSMIYE